MDFLLRCSKIFFLFSLGCFFTTLSIFVFFNEFQHKDRLVMISKHAIDRVTEKVFEKDAKILHSLVQSYASPPQSSVKTSSSSFSVPNNFSPMIPPQQTELAPSASSDTKKQTKAIQKTVRQLGTYLIDQVLEAATKEDGKLIRLILQDAMKSTSSSKKVAEPPLGAEVARLIFERLFQDPIVQKHIKNSFRDIRWMIRDIRKNLKINPLKKEVLKRVDTFALETHKSLNFFIHDVRTKLVDGIQELHRKKLSSAIKDFNQNVISIIQSVRKREVRSLFSRVETNLISLVGSGANQAVRSWRAKEFAIYNP